MRFSLRAALAAAAFACVVALPPLLRLVALREKQVLLTTADGRGFVADVVVGAFVALGLWALGRGRKTRIASAVLGALWLLVNVVNFEHVRVLDAPVSVTYAGYLFDPVFLQGSGLQLSRPLLTLGAILLVLVGIPRWPSFRSPGRRGWFAGAGVAACALGALALWPIRRDQLNWRQDAFLVQNARDAFSRAFADQPPIVHDAATLRQLFQPDLSGQPRFALEGKKHNVLIVLVEGLSGAYFPSAARQHHVVSDVRAPKLDEWGTRGLSYTTVIAHQRQTNRGEYSLLCGDYPKFVSEEARMTEYARGGARACLPKLLAAAGYQTAYLQAAPLGFMLKDQFMARAGFERSLGSDYFTHPYAQNRWGVDDKTFFEQSLSVIRELRSKEQPWLLTMLTVGTHHPYLVPAGFEAKGSAFSRAVAYADEAASEFLAALEQEGVLEDTLVLITSDESAGVSRGDDVTRSATQSWIPLIALVPGHKGGQVKEVFLQSELGLSVLDYLALAERAPHFVGRSIFRSYDSRRPVYFANTHLKKGWALEPSGILSTCTERLDDCASYLVDYERAFAPRRQPLVWRPELMRAWRTVVDHASRPLYLAQRNAPRTVPLLTHSEVQLAPTGNDQLVFGGQYLDVAKGWRAEVELDVELRGSADGAVTLTHPFWSPAGRLHKPFLPTLRAGDRVSLRYQFVFGADANHVEAVLLARTAGTDPMKLVFHKAQLKLDQAPLNSRVGVHNEKVTVERRPLERSLSISLDSPGYFRHAGCLKNAERSLEGECGAGFLVYGPYAWAPPGAKVKARFEVEVMSGEALVRGEVTNEGGSRRLGTSEAVRLTAGSKAVLESTVAAQARLDTLEARLESKPVKASARIVVRSATLAIEL